MDHEAYEVKTLLRKVHLDSEGVVESGDTIHSDERQFKTEDEANAAMTKAMQAIDHKGQPCEHLTYGGKCSLKFYLLQDSYEEVIKSCPIHKTPLLAGNECYHIGATEVRA